MHCQGVLRWAPDSEVEKEWLVSTCVFRAALVILFPFFICSSEGQDTTAWQHTASTF